MSASGTTPRPLVGKVAIVTGASSGIGAATAVAYARAGASLTITGRNVAALHDTAAAITAATGAATVTAATGAATVTAATGAATGDSRAGGDVLVHTGDIADSAFCDGLIDAAVEHFGRLDVLANVAGVITRGDATETTDDEFLLNMAVNVNGVFWASRAAVRAMRRHGDGGAIINLASNVGIVGCAGLPAYCASKGAVILLTKSMALDHAAEGIRVNALCPGAVDTPMLTSGHEKTGRTPEEVHAANIAAIPQGWMPDPADIAETMVFLAADASRHITGVALPIDGGYTAG